MRRRDDWEYILRESNYESFSLYNREIFKQYSKIVISSTRYTKCSNLHISRQFFSFDFSSISTTSNVKTFWRILNYNRCINSRKINLLCFDQWVTNFFFWFVIIIVNNICFVIFLTMTCFEKHDILIYCLISNQLSNNTFLLFENVIFVINVFEISCILNVVFIDWFVIDDELCDLFCFNKILNIKKNLFAC